MIAGSQTPLGAAPISLLINSIYYFIDFVFMKAEDDGYRLMVIHRNKLLLDKIYKTIRGAKIAFVRSFNFHDSIHNVKPSWSFFYTPEPGWLDEKLTRLTTQETLAK